MACLPTSSRFRTSFLIALLGGSLAVGSVTPAAGQAVRAEDIASASPAKPATSTTSRKLDYSGQKRIGKASFYAKKFAGRKMADGGRMDPRSNNAASRTLPLGTKAQVTNLETGQSATVHIRDRGPYVKGRIVDLSPSTARSIGIDNEKGIARVKVVPIEIPLGDGEILVVAANKTKLRDNEGQ
jgi:rare lipoprotein A